MLSNEQLATIIVDLGYGDSGKGSLTDACSGAAKEGLVVRFNGGSQAGHRVVTPDGRSHVFSQFGSGTFHPGIRTLLSKHMLISPLAFLNEEKHLRDVGVKDAFRRTAVSEEALVISLFQRAANRLRELARGDGRHGSCGHGVGETASDAIGFPDHALRMRHLRQAGLLKRLQRIQERKRDEAAESISKCRSLPEAQDEIRFLEDAAMPERWIELLRPFQAQVWVYSEEAIRKDLLLQKNVIFEGAQGVLLDEWRGFHPYTTWSTCTFDNAVSLLKAYGWTGAVEKTGVIRGYATRHGAGPFPTEDPDMSSLLTDTDNVANDWQKDFRVGWLDLVAIRYAIAACGGIDNLAITCLDRLAPFKSWMVCNEYETKSGSIGDLPLGQLHDLAHQEDLTGLLMSARPKFKMTTEANDLERKARDHAIAIHFLLKRPSAHLRISTGPTREDHQRVF
jgi:adenylosuccinate synthase